MPIINSIAAMQDEMAEWRQDIHAHPELAFEEHRTSQLVAEKLESWGIKVTRGLGKTGLVGTLEGREPGSRTIGLRADMDALPILEENDLSYKSQNEGVMHACGHDGHTTILLGAAKYLAETRNFKGTVHFIFQPAEEGYAGAKAMIKDGLFERFPCDEVYGLHNYPEMPLGSVGVTAGPMMAAADTFDIRINGRGGHGAYPHNSIDPVLIGSQIVVALQSIVSRNANPQKSGVISVTRFHAGEAFNVIPDTALLGGTVRTFDPKVQDMIEMRMGEIAGGIASALGGRAELVYRRGYPVTVNNDEKSEVAAEIAAKVVGMDKVQRDVEPVMGAEDFSYMLNEKPGCYIWLGQKGEGAGKGSLHHPEYNFNDAALPIGASYFANLVEERLGRAA
ncbi:MAG TPA: M20 aminoacylase family protein [Alphaproteobacteria bacterium]|nr:M20 aminoacylase family protein [Alphaproteobacteria bacterium]